MSFECEKCGHVNIIEGEWVSVPISGLLPSDKGQPVRVRHHSGFLVGWGREMMGERVARYVDVDYNLPWYETIHESGGGRHFYYGQDDEVEIWRRVNG